MRPPRKSFLLTALATMLVALGACEVAAPGSFAASLRRVMDGTGGKDTIRGKTKRNNGRSLRAIIEDVNRTTKGWYEYFQHSHWTTFKPLDQWIRMRLRSILRKRAGRRGRGRGRDFQRWPNAYFAAQGCFFLVEAHAAACQSSRR